MFRHNSDHDNFQSRARTLEALFFQKRDAELIANLRAELLQLEEKHQLAHISGILDQQVLLDLVRVGVTAESLLAMRYVPMICVAWSDGALSDKERDAVLAAAADENVAPDSAAHRLLVEWLKRPPAQEVGTAWKEYVHALAKVVPPESIRELRARTEKLCERVAAAAGGFLGLGSVSAVERAAIRDFAGAWSQN